MEEYLDSELVHLAQQGEAKAFNILVERYQGKVTQLVYRYVNNTDTALDLVQDIFFKLFRNLDSYKGDAKFSSWLFRIAVNDCIDHIRRVKVRKEQSLDHIREYGFDVKDEASDADVEQNYSIETERRLVRQVLHELPPGQQSVVVMKVYQDMTFDEIAEVLEQPVSTIKSRLYKALNNMGSKIRRTKVLKEVRL